MAESVYDRATDAVRQVQDFNASSLVRLEELGRNFSFDAAQRPAERLIRLFKQIPIVYISELTEDFAHGLEQQALATFNRFNEILAFDPTAVESPSAKRDSLIANLEQAYTSTFNAIWQTIAYLSSRERDFGAMEVEARAVVETVRKEAESLKASLEEQNNAAHGILSDIRTVAAEQGVSQQAIYFREEGEFHDREAKVWQRNTVISASALGAYGFVTIFFHKIPFIAPSNAYETTQLAVSKLLIFIVIAYIVTLCAKNFLAHKHNQVVNKHRQNALMTYKALADAANDSASRDIVLSHAADCIFSPQETGLNSSQPKGTFDSAPTLQVMPRISSAAGST